MQVIPASWLRLFNPGEVNQLLSGGEGGGLDAADMRVHARYSGGYTPDSPTVKAFWKVGLRVWRRFLSSVTSAHVVCVPASPLQQ